MKNKFITIIKACFLGAMSVFVALPVAMMNREPNCVSEIDNTMLPEWNDETFSASDIDNYIDKRIGLREDAIDANIVINDVLFGELEHPTYMYGQNGYVFFNSLQEIHTPDTAWIDAFCSYLKKAQQYCEERNVPFLYCINPSKTTVYNRYLPKGYVYDNRFLQTLYAKLNEYEVNWISNVELLEEKSYEQQVYDVAYDPGHWNDLGQFYATNHMLEAVSRAFPSVKTKELSDYTVRTVTRTTQEGTYFATSEQTYAFTLNNTNVEAITGYEGIELHKNYRAFACLKNLGEQVNGLPRVLFFHGSYYNRNRDFYKDAFAETYAVHNYQNLLNIDYYFNIFQPECVILETAEYATQRYWFDYDKLCNKQLNKPFAQVKEVEHITKPISAFEWTKTEEGLLCALELKIDGSYTYGYLEASGITFDLAMGDGTATCAIDTSKADITAAKLHLYE